ncbi:MAG: type IV toxin-antitoxin system AbiEi family antitoxin [Candidatus Bathyarchaeia archaeon]
MDEDSKDLAGGMQVRRPLSGLEATLLSSLSSRGRNIFTLDDVMDSLDVSYDYAKVIVNRLVKKSWVIQLARGKYLIVPLEAGVRGQYSEHGFVVASHLVEPYYVGYLSALNHHGLTELVPNTIYVATTKRRRDRTILYRRFHFVTIREEKMFGAMEVSISGSVVRISDPEKTIVDCLDHPEYCNGVEEVAESIFFEHGELDIERILGYAEKIGNRTVIKRLGYVLEKLGIEEYDELFRGIQLSKGYPKLDPTQPEEGAYNTEWGLQINTDINPRRWIQ